MSITDPIADGLTIIRNASRAKHEKADMPASKLMEEILKILKKQGYISNYKRIPDSKVPSKQGLLRAYLKFNASNKSAIRDIKRISKPGRRVYVRSDEIPNVLQGLGLSIITTSRGILTGKDARQQKVGGEILCYIW